MKPSSLMVTDAVKQWIPAEIHTGMTMLFNQTLAVQSCLNMIKNLTSQLQH